MYKIITVTIKPRFTIGQWVYPKADPDQNARLVVGYEIRTNNRFIIITANHDNERHHEEYELSDVKTFMP